jgi:hypothetical protein
MRSISEPFVVAPPAAARIRTRLRLTAADQAVLRAVGEHLGRLAGADLAWRCRLGREKEQRAVRKQALTVASSSRWAGSLTRTSNDQWERALANLADRRIALRRAVRMIRSRLVVPVGSKQGRVRSYANRVERFVKQGRLQHRKRFRRTISGIPTHRFRDLLVGMGRQPPPVGHRRGPRLDLGMGTALLARTAQPVNQAVGHRQRPSRGGGGDRTTRPGPWGPAAARCARPRPEDRGGRATGQAGPPAPGP